MTTLEGLGFYDVTKEPADPEIAALRVSVRAIIEWRQKYEDGEASADGAIQGIYEIAQEVLGEN